MTSYAGQKQSETRGHRGKARDLEEMEALEQAQGASRLRLVTAIRAEWEEFVQANAHVNDDGQLIWSERLIRALADDGLATLRYLARGGDREAARLLVDRLLGEPDMPYREKVKKMNEQQAMGQIEEILGKKLSDIPIDALLFAFGDPPPPRLEGE